MGNFGDIDSAFTRDELKGGTFEPTYSGAVSSCAANIPGISLASM